MLTLLFKVATQLSLLILRPFQKKLKIRENKGVILAELSQIPPLY